MRRVALAIATAVAIALAAGGLHDADACGAFFSPSKVGAPSLSVEQVLLLWDEPSQTEHFIREVTFKRAGARFGFVVPTPTKPEVNRVERPFRALAREFHFGGGSGYGSGHGRSEPEVQVVSVKRVGSFTVFVLAASVATALDKWLSENQFGTTPASKAWLEHYVALGFFFSAFRYEPSMETDASLASETVDIAFSTPAPYYPYLEPDHEAQEEPRIVALWLVTERAMQPVAARREGEHVTWKRPFREGRRHEPWARSKLAALLPALEPLLPRSTTPLVVQTFQDQKSSRRGFGDAVFVPEQARELTPAEVEARRSLFAVLDPALEPKR
jgi:hypothetical protein